MSKKLSSQFIRDYEFYFSNKDKITFSGTNIKKDFLIQFPNDPPDLGKDEDGKTIFWKIPYNINGFSAKMCFYSLDSIGKYEKCSEPELLVQLLNCKMAVNLQIKMWAEGRADGTLCLIELEQYCAFYNSPEWVLRAVENQKVKILKQWANEGKYNNPSEEIKDIALFHFNEMILEKYQNTFPKEYELYKKDILDILIRN
jgi:hypothetical protein